MFVKIGMGIFNTADIEAVEFGDDDIKVTLKPRGEDENGTEYTVEKESSSNPALDKLVAEMNAK